MAAPVAKVEFGLADGSCAVIDEMGARRACAPGEVLERAASDVSADLFDEEQPYRYYVSYVEYYKNGGFGIDQAFVSRPEPMISKEAFDALVADICAASGDDLETVILVSLIDANA